MTKSPYEIRLDVLQMAKDMLEKEANFKQSVYLSRIDQGINFPKGSDPVPESITTADIVNKANELYKFVDDTSKASSRSYTSSNPTLLNEKKKD